MSIQTKPAAPSPSDHEAAALLWQHHQAGSTLAELPGALRPQDEAQGHAIQAALPLVAGQAVVGWKIAATSAAGQAHINVKGPLAGRILAGFVHPVGSTLGLQGNHMRVVEPEFAFRFGANLPAQAAPRGVDEVFAAVAALHPAFELPDSRYTDFTRVGEAQLIADNACCGRFLFGPAVADADWREADLAAHAVQARVHGAEGALRYTREGAGRAILGDPRLALTWLVNDLAARGIPLAAGAFVSVGTCMVPLQVLPGDRVTADYGRFGRIEVGLAA